MLHVNPVSVNVTEDPHTYLSSGLASISITREKNTCDIKVAFEFE